MRHVMGIVFRRPHTKTLVKVTGVKREKGKAYVLFAPDFPRSHLMFGKMDIKRFNRLVGRKPFPKPAPK